jgi:hypothetical protein
LSSARSEHVVLFAFIGRILGKALYEGITTGIPCFAHYFLETTISSHALLFLSTVDPQLYNNLVSQDVNTLKICPIVYCDRGTGGTRIPLIPNRANIDVKNTNKRHLNWWAGYYVDRVREQSEAALPEDCGK